MHRLLGRIGAGVIELEYERQLLSVSRVISTLEVRVSIAVTRQQLLAAL